VEALGHLGAAAATPEVISRLLELTHDVDRDVRIKVVEALGDLGAAAATPEVISRLLELTHDVDKYVHIKVVKALGDLGTAAGNSQVILRLLDLIENGAYFPGDFVRFVGVLDGLATDVRIFAMDDGSFQVMKVEDLSK
jgi:HEAT repeat protein